MITQRLINTPQYIILFLILTLGKLSTHVESIRFEVQSGKTKCIVEEIRKNCISLGKYHIVKENEAHPLPDSHKVKVKAVSVHGKQYHQSDKVTEGNFVFHTEGEGDCVACFSAVDHKPPVTLTIEFEWKSGTATKDWSHVVKKDSIESMEMELKEMYDIAYSIYDEAYYLHERENEALTINIAANTEMAWLSFLSIVLCISVAGLQFWHLKSFFQKKKLI
ncbi:hypothetical protein Leryth_008036 [Lithospermum erythrorhizon]|nr:hypothetical protein Leryth_008036 [Lithospermum erythrorhizon]